MEQKRCWGWGCQQAGPVPSRILHGHTKALWLQGQVLTAPPSMNKAPWVHNSPTRAIRRFWTLFRQLDLIITLIIQCTLRCKPHATFQPQSVHWRATRMPRIFHMSSHFSFSWFGVSFSSKFMQHFIIINGNYTWSGEVSTKSISLEGRSAFQLSRKVVGKGWQKIRMLFNLKLTIYRRDLDR